jgi:hypothetical protein
MRIAWVFGLGLGWYMVLIGKRGVVYSGQDSPLLGFLCVFALTFDLVCFGFGLAWLPLSCLGFLYLLSSLYSLS